MKNKDIIYPTLSVTTFFVFTLCIVAPSQIFLTNSAEFNVRYFDLLGQLSLFALPVFFLFSILLILLPDTRNIHKKTVVLLLSLSLLLWLQGNILVWDYGLLTGGKIEFNHHFIVFSAVIWLAVIVTMFIKYQFFYKNAWIIGGVFVVVQIVSTSILLFNQPQIPGYINYELDDRNEFTFSKDKNVIILVLDTFEASEFQKIINDNEDYKDIFADFTYFPDAMSGFPTTYASIANILTGQYYDNSMLFSDFCKQAYSSSSSIPNVLKQMGFEVDLFLESNEYLDKNVISNIKAKTGIPNSIIVNLYDASLFRYSPDILKNCVYNDGKWFLKRIIPTKHIMLNDKIFFNNRALTNDDIAFINRLLLNANTIEEKNIFKFYHLNGSHAPWVLNEELEYEEMGSDGYHRQAEASLKIVNIFLEELKRLELYDNSMIFVLGDHGIFKDVKTVSNANPLLLVKNFVSHQPMTVSKAQVCLSDIPNTIFSALGLTDYANGKSIFELEEIEYRERRFLYYNWQDDWLSDHLPPIKEYIITGPVWQEQSWQLTGNEFIPQYIEKPYLEWGDGFYPMEGNEEYNWHWCSSEGELTIYNASNKSVKYLVRAVFYTGYPEPTHLKIESTLFNEDLKINNSGQALNKETDIPTGSHVVKFTCDARKFDTPDNDRILVFRVDNFQIIEEK